MPHAGGIRSGFSREQGQTETLKRVPEDRSAVTMEFDDIETIAVLGAGNMGHGIAEVAALAGYDVNLRDVKEEFVQSDHSMSS